MSNPEAFLVTPAPSERPKTPVEHERDELREDMDTFSPDAQSVIEKYLKDPSSLNPKESVVLKEERERWWLEKYGFPYYQKAPRMEVLAKKYATPEHVVAARALQEKLFTVVAGGTESEIKTVKKEYYEKYPDQIEGIEVVSHLVPFLKLSKRLSEEKIPDPHERRELFQDLTEYQFLITHFLNANGHDSEKDFLNLFWKTLEILAQHAGCSRELNIVRRGVVTQVATFKIFEALGSKPVLSHPRQDAFESIDLWSDQGHAVQVKSTFDQEPKIIETDEIAFPGIQVKENDEVKHFNSRLFRDQQRFKMKVANYGKNVKGYFIVIPNSKVDFVTGQPDRSLIEFAREKMQ